jgi:lipoprotein-anchoring transpeptidase ErfK/SrfK
MTAQWRAAKAWRTWKAAVVVTTAAGLLLASGCQATSPTPAAQAAAARPGAAGASAATTITFEPVSSSTDVRPDAAVSVVAQGGTLTAVAVVDSRGRAVDGALDGSKTRWTAGAPLLVAQHYRITAKAMDGAGKALERTAVFSTVKPKATLKTSISPLSGAEVGVGMPIIVRFNKAVSDRAAVERGLVVTGSKPADGAWSWISDTEVHYRPQKYWPANDKVTLNVRLRGVQAGKKVWSLENRTVTFKTTASMVSTVDVARHIMTVRRNGEVARVVPITSGKAGFLTRNGIKVVLEKHVLKVMDSATVGIPKGDPDYYKLDVPYALRVTWSGEFVHAAPWSTANQGLANVSHGCVGMSLSNAIWFFNLSHVGDVIKVINSPRTLEPGNGYTDWNVPWRTWLKGSALGVASGAPAVGQTDAPATTVG